MDVFQSGQDRFLICSRGLQVIFLLCIITIAILRSLRIWVDKMIDCEQQLCIEYAQKTNDSLQNRQQPQKQGEQIQDKKPIDQKTLGFKILYRIQMIIKDFSLMGVVILNIICFTSYQFLLVSTVIYIVLAVLRLQTLIKPENIYIYMFLQRIPNLLCVTSWFINFLAIPVTDIF